MTAQIPDKVIYKNEKFDLVGVRGSKLFDPEIFGLKLMSASTACYNGYILIFKCESNEFILDELHVRTQEPVDINGVKAEKYEGPLKFMFSHEYKNLQLKVNFTGEIYIARDFIEEMYVHMGYQSPTAFREVFGFIIEDDKIIEVKDLSKKMEEKRIEDPLKDSYPTNPDDSENIKEWVNKKFSREIDE